MKKSLSIVLGLLFVFGVASTALAGPFADVPLNHWAYDAVNSLAKAGIVEGYDDGAFRGNKAITRYEMAIVVGKAMERSDKASAENKAIIDKLANEFAQELNNLGVRVARVENKVNEMSKTSFSGDFYLRNVFFNERIDGDNNKASFWRDRIRINFQNRAADDLTVFARFGARNTFGTGGATQAPFFSAGSNSNYQAIDQYGIKYNNNNWNFSIGRQGVSLGQGLILSTGNDVEWDNKFNGVIASTKFGAVNANFVAGMTDAAGLLQQFDAVNFYDNTNVTTQWYGADLSTKLAENFTLGYAYAHAKRSNVSDASRNYQAVNLSYAPAANLTFNAEFGKSNAPTLNKAYTIGGTYNFGKDSFTAQYLKVDRNANDMYNSVYNIVGMYVYGGARAIAGGTMKGWDFYYCHPMSKTTWLDVYFIDTTTPGHSGHEQDGFIGLNAKF